MVTGLSIPDLGSVLAYKDELPVLVFVRNHKIDIVAAKQLWLDTLSWLWLGRVHQLDRGVKPRKLRIYPALIPIDEMWHSFILCTRSYDKFCRQEFGNFLHHEPKDPDENGPSNDDFTSEVRYVSDRVGPDFAVRVYVQNKLRFQSVIDKVLHQGSK